MAALLAPRRSLLLLATLTCAACGLLVGCQSGNTETSGFDMSAAVVRGMVVTNEGSPVGGATVVVVEEGPVAECRPLVPYGSFARSTVTGHDGRFVVKAQGPPISAHQGCVSIHVRAPNGSGLADTAQHNLRVTMRSESAGKFDTLSIGSVVLRKN